MVTREADNGGEESLISTIEYPEASSIELVILPFTYLFGGRWSLHLLSVLVSIASLLVIKSLISIDWLVVAVLH